MDVPAGYKLYLLATSCTFRLQAVPAGYRLYLMATSSTYWIQVVVEFAMFVLA